MMKSTERNALLWLKNEIANIPNFISRDEINESITLKGKKHPPLCQIVLFEYGASVGNKEGYWDKYPIVIIVRPLEDHFFGFNIHYLNDEIRKKIISVITVLNKKASGNVSSAFRMIYPFLDGLVKMKVFNSAYKNYNYSNLKSKFVIIHPDHYHLVSNLPIATLKENPS